MTSNWDRAVDELIMLEMISSVIQITLEIYETTGQRPTAPQIYDALKRRQLPVSGAAP